jgi:hypothetical protein
VSMFESAKHMSGAKLSSAFARRVEPLPPMRRHVLAKIMLAALAPLLQGQVPDVRTVQCLDVCRRAATRSRHRWGTLLSSVISTPKAVRQL